MNNCDDDATCTNTDGSFTCACNIGFTGDGVTCDGFLKLFINFDTCLHFDTFLLIGLCFKLFKKFCS